jgi:hypothetical protein
MQVVVAVLQGKVLAVVVQEEAEVVVLETIKVLAEAALQILVAEVEEHKATLTKMEILVDLAVQVL